MIFNSLNFAIFLPIVFLLYWFVLQKKLIVQNLLLLVSSYFFYACWDYRFLFLLIFSTLLDYYTGIKMDEAQNQKHKKIWFWLSISVNLGLLGVLKYYNFFADTFAILLSQFGLKSNFWILKIALPVGISFYTFHGLSYVIDIYKNRIKPVTNFIEYSVFVSFFPLLVAGPIERATHLLPQIQAKRQFNYIKVVDGLRQILWGLFKKVVVADNCAEYANLVFNDAAHQSGSNLVLGAVFFAFQIYCDFSGYSDIALGTAKLFGIDLLRNFNYPYFSRDIAEFWRKWHISLSSWFKDYVYIPLGGSSGSNLTRIRNTFIIFLLSGFWHGANWTFVFWGLLNAIYFLPLLLMKSNRNNIETVAQGRLLPSFGETFNILLTFSLTTVAWIFFRAENIRAAFQYLNGIFSLSLFSLPRISYETKLSLCFILIMIFVEWIQREKKHGLEIHDSKMPFILRWSLYTLIALSIILFGGASQEFIYFQF